MRTFGQALRRGGRAACLSLALVLVAVGSSSCGSQRANPERPPEPAPLATENLVELLPAAGLRFLCVGKPRALLDNTAFRAAIERVIPEPRLSAFAARTGIELERAETALIAGYDLATVYGATGDPALAARVLARFRERLRDGAQESSPHPRLQRVSGSSSETPAAAMAIGERSALVSVGDPRLVVVAEAFALGRLRRSPAALRGAALSRLPPPAPDALAVLYVPGPFAGEWSRAADGLFERVEAVLVSVTPASNTSARFHVDLVGEFGPDALERLRGAVASVTASAIGRVMGLDQPAAPPTFEKLTERLVLDLTLEIRPIADGLHAAISGEAWEILKLPSPKPE